MPLQSQQHEQLQATDQPPQPISSLGPETMKREDEADGASEKANTMESENIVPKLTMDGELVIDGTGREASDGEDDNAESEEEERGEPFETYKHKVIQLCHEIGLGEPLELEEMFGGESHRVIGLKFVLEKYQDCVLRIPWIPWDAENQSHEVVDQVALLHYLSQFDYLHTPSVLAYDTTTENVLEAQYVLSTRLPGLSLDLNYYELPLREKLEVVALVSELILKMETIKFDKPGRLVGNRSLPKVAHTAPASTNEITIIGFRALPFIDMPPMESQPLSSLIIALLKYRETESSTPWEQMSIKCRKLQRIALQMERAGLMRTTDNQNVLWHWDFAARNILMQRTDNSNSTENIETTTPQKPANSNDLEIQLPAKEDLGKWSITGVLDWDDALSVPLIIARRPPAWLWFNEDDRGYWDGENDAKPPRDLTSEELLIKAHFDQLMSNASPIYIEDAYHRGPWIRELARFGLQGFADGEDWKRWEPFVKKWDKYFESTGLKTVEDDEVEKNMIEEWADVGGGYSRGPQLHHDIDDEVEDKTYDSDIAAEQSDEEEEIDKTDDSDAAAEQSDGDDEGDNEDDDTYELDVGIGPGETENIEELEGIEKSKD